MAERVLSVEVRGNARSFTTSMRNARAHLRQFEQQVMRTNSRIANDVRRTAASTSVMGGAFAHAAGTIRRSGQGITRTMADVRQGSTGVTRSLNNIGTTSQRAGKQASGAFRGVSLAAGTMAMNTNRGLGTMNQGFSNTRKHAGAMHADFENYAGFIGFQMLGRQAIVMGTMILGAFALATKSFADFEDSFALVRKTVDASEGEFAVLSGEIRELARTIPIAVEELNEVAGAAGQLGVPAKHIRDFTKVMAELGVATDLTAEEAAISMARIAAVMQENLGDEGVGRMSSALVDLGNNFAAREGEIVNFTERIASTGAVVGMATADMFAFSTAFTAVGVRAERGGTAFQRVVFEMMQAVQSGGKQLEIMAETAGMTAEQFAELWRGDPSMALVEFIEGLDRSGTQASAIMEELFGKNVRITQSFLAAASAGDLVRNALNLGRDAFEQNTARAAEAEERFATLTNRLKVMGQRINDVAIRIGEQLAPVVENIAAAVVSAIEAFASLPEPVQEFAMVLAATAAVAAVVAGSMALMVFPLNVLRGMLPELTAKWAALTGAQKAQEAATLRAGVALRGTAGPVKALTASQAALLASTAPVPGYFGRMTNAAKAGTASIIGMAKAIPALLVGLGKVVLPIAAIYGAWKLLSYAHDRVQKEFMDVSAAAETAAESMGVMLDGYETSVERLNSQGAVAQFRVDNEELLDSFDHMEAWQREHAVLQIALEMQQRGASAEEISDTLNMIQKASPYSIYIDPKITGDLENPAAYFNRLSKIAKKSFEEIDLGGANHRIRSQLDEIGRSLGILFNTDADAFRIEWESLADSIDSSGVRVTAAMHQMRGGFRDMFEAMGLSSDEAVRMSNIFDEHVNYGLSRGLSTADAFTAGLEAVARQAADSGMPQLALDIIDMTGKTDHATMRTRAMLQAQLEAAKGTEDAGDAANDAAGDIKILGDSWGDVANDAENATDELKGFYGVVRSGISELVGAARAISDLEAAQENQAKAAADVRAAERNLVTARRNAERLPQDIAAAERELAAARAGGARDADAITDAERRLEDERIRAQRLPEDIQMAERDLAEARADGDPEQIIRAERRLQDLRLEAQRMPEDLARAERNLGEARGGGGQDADKITQLERKLEDLRDQEAATADEIAEAERGVTQARRDAANVVWDNIEANEKFNESMIELLGALADGAVDSKTLADVQDELKRRFGLTDDEVNILSDSFVGIIEKAIDTGSEFEELGGDVNILRGVFNALGADSDLMFSLLSENANEAKKDLANILEAMGIDQKKAMSAAETIFDEGGHDAAVALLSQLTTGGGDVSKILREYLKTITENLDPVLKGLGKEPIALPGGKEFVVPGTSMRIRAEGGIDKLPNQAKIQEPRNNLVQWAEPETEGEAFIPLARSKRERSVKIWQKTGELLGLSPDEQYVQGDIRGLNPQFLNQFRMWSQTEGPFSITSGWRSTARQAQLYAAYKAGRGNLAARPGSSKHEQGLAIDHAPHSWPIARTATPFGLTHPVRSESWHVEPQWARGGGDGSEYSALIGNPDDVLADVPDFPHNGFFQSGPRAAEAARDRALEFLNEHMFQYLDPIQFESAGGNEGLKNMAREMLRGRGWESMWNAFNTLVSKESSWNPSAQNPSSTAYGLGQFLNSTWATVGARKTSDPGAQLQAMMDYIAQRYGNPMKALQFHLANNWYKDGGFNGIQQFDSGGLLQPGATLAINRTGSPEPVSRFADGGITLDNVPASFITKLVRKSLEFGTSAFSGGGPATGVIDPYIHRRLTLVGDSADHMAEAIEDATAALEEWEEEVRRTEEINQRQVLQSNIKDARDAARLVRGDPDAFAAAKERELEAVRSLQKFDLERARANERAQAQRRIARAQEELAIRRQIEANKELFRFERMSAEEQIADISRRMENEREFTDEWMSLYNQRERLLEDSRATENRIRQNKELFAFERMSTERQIADLTRRIAAERAFTDEWMSLYSQRQRLIEEELSDRETAERDALDSLNRLLDEYQDIQQSMTDARENHQKAVQDAEKRHTEALAAANKRRSDAIANAVQQRNERLRQVEERAAEDRLRIVRDRAKALFDALDPQQRLEHAWSNTIGAVTRNITSQLADREAWAEGIANLRRMGLSEEAIEALGLNDMTAGSLATVQRWSSATGEEIQQLNEGIIASHRWANEVAQSEARSQHGAVGEAMRELAQSVADETAQIHADHRDALAEINREHREATLAAREELNETLTQLSEDLKEELARLTGELQAIGQDQGRSYAEAVAAGIASGIPAIIAQVNAVKAATAALRSAQTEHGRTSGGKIDPNMSHSALVAYGKEIGYKDDLSFLRNRIRTKGYDTGGVLPPGLTMAYNGTRQAEYVLRQSKSTGNEPAPVYVTVENITTLDGRVISREVTQHQEKGERRILVQAGKRGNL